MAHQAVAFFHFVHAPGERVGGQLHVGDHGREQMRNAFIDGQFQHFRVNHNHADFFGRGFIQHRQNHAVHAHRFARTGGAGHQQMRRFGQIGNDRVAADVLPQREREFGRALREFGRIEHFTQTDGLAFGIGQFQSHAGFARNRFHHADGGHTERACQIFFQIDDGIAAYAHVGFDFIARNHRAGISVQHLHFHFKFRQLFFNDDAVFQQFFGALHGLRIVLRRLQQLQRRQGGFCGEGGFPRVAQHIGSAVVLLLVVSGEIGFGQHIAGVVKFNVAGRLGGGQGGSLHLRGDGGAVQLGVPAGRCFGRGQAVRQFVGMALRLEMHGFGNFRFGDDGSGEAGHRRNRHGAGVCGGRVGQRRGCGCCLAAVLAQQACGMRPSVRQIRP